MAVLTVFNAVQLYNAYAEWNEARVAERIALKKITLLDSVTSLLKDGEIYKRSNLWFDTNNYKATLKTVSKTAFDQINQLKGLENESPDPQKSIRVFVELVRQKLISEAEALRTQQLIVDTTLLDQIRIVATQISTREQQRVDTISSKIELRMKHIFETVSWAASAALMLLLFTTRRSNSYTKERVNSEFALLIANKKLKETEVLSNLVMHSTHECVMIVDLSGVVQFISYGGQRMLKIGDEWMKSDWLSLWTAEIRTAAKDALNLAKEGEIGRFTGNFRTTKFGPPPWLDVEVSPIRDASLKVTQLLILCHDVTARKRAEDRRAQMTLELRSSEAGLKKMMEALPLLMWTAGVDGVFKDFNNRWQHYSGKNSADTLEAEWELAIHPEDLKAWTGLWSRARVSGETVNVQLRIKQASDGNYRWHMCRAEPLRNDENQITKWIGTCTDIHDQKQAAVEVNLRHQKLKSFLDVAPVALWATDRNGTVIVSEGKLRDVAKIAKPGTELLDGRWLETSYSPLLGPDGTEDGLVGVSADVTEKKMYELASKEFEEKRNQLLIRENAAVQAHEMKSRFLANMSHDIRIPLNGVLGMSSLLKGTELTDEQREYTSAIESSADALLLLVNDILDLSKAEAGKTELVDVDFELERLMQELEKTFMFSARKKGLDLQVTISPEIPRVLKGDAARLRQVLTNFASNAIKFTSEGQVSIRATVLRESLSHITLQFEVADTGVGLSKKMIQRLFHARSNGMGLAICKHLVALMGGEIGARANAGKGATFFVTIPFMIEEQPEAATNLEITTPMKTRSLRILVAEDNSVNSLLAARMLEKMGHTVETVTNGLDAVNALKSGHFDLVFMDCQMPELDGYEATRRIRADVMLKLRNIPIVAMTGNALTGDREKCLDSGMNDYVSKPLTLDDLAKAILYCVPEELKVAS